MMTTARVAINAYVQTDIDTAVPGADGHRLVVMLFDGALGAVADARIKMVSGDIPGRGHAISKAIAIVDEGLRASLDLERGGEIAGKLEDLYRYICSRLLHANMRAEPAALDEAAKLLSELQSGWKAIAGAQPPRKAVVQEAVV